MQFVANHYVIMLLTVGGVSVSYGPETIKGMLK